MAVSLTDVESAISAIQSGSQSFTVDGVSYTKANVNALIQLRTKLQREAERSGGSRPVMRAFNFTGMGYGTTSSADTPTPVIGNLG